MNPDDDRDDDLRRALHDAVSDVEPHGSLDDIRSRTDQVVPMTRSTTKRWILPTVAAAAVMAAVVGGAFWLGHDDSTTSGPSGTPNQSVSPSHSPDTGTGTTSMRAVPVYYVGDTAHGKKLFREFHQEEVMDGLDTYLGMAAARTALTGNPTDPDYTNPWPDGVQLAGSEFGKDGITLDLHGDVHDRPAGMSEADAQLAIEQLIYSAQAGLGQGRPPVQLLLDGKHTDTILGVPTAEPLAAGNADDVLAPVQIDSPVNGAEVSGTFTVTGRAATFEANVVWELKQGGTVVKKGFTTAAECCTLAPYSFEVTAPAGDYTLVVHDTDDSGQGLPVDQDTRAITVR